MDERLAQFREDAATQCAELRAYCATPQAVTLAVTHLSERAAAAARAAMAESTDPSAMTHDAESVPFDPSAELSDLVTAAIPTNGGFEGEQNAIGFHILWRQLECLDDELRRKGLGIADVAKEATAALLTFALKFASMGRGSFNRLHNRKDLRGTLDWSVFASERCADGSVRIELKEDLSEERSLALRGKRGPLEDNRFHCPALDAMDAVVPFVVQVYLAHRAQKTASVEPAAQS